MTDIEFEAKFYPVDKETYRRKLKSVGAKLVVPERKMIRVVGDRLQNTSLTKNNYIRVRDEGNLVRLSLKTTAKEGGKMSDQKEVDVEVSDFDKAIRILNAVGVTFNRKQESLREEWSYKGAQITLDTWPGLETYSEVEADSEDAVKEIALELGLNWEKRMIVPAAEVYAKVYKISIDEVLEKISYITFENNPFSGLTKKWNGD
jgi:adenylate cyclase class 2